MHCVRRGPWTTSEAERDKRALPRFVYNELMTRRGFLFNILPRSDYCLMVTVKNV